MKFFSTLSRTLALGISGLAVGWLMGLTITPNVQHVITEILALLIGIISILAGTSVIKKNEKAETTTKTIEDEKANGASSPPAEPDLSTLAKPALKHGTSGDDVSKVARQFVIDSLWPVAGFMAGLMLGSTVGLLVRTNGLLGPNPTLLTWRWKLDTTQQKSLVNQLLLMSYGLRQPIKEKESSIGKSGIKPTVISKRHQGGKTNGSKLCKNKTVPSLESKHSEAEVAKTPAVQDDNSPKLPADMISILYKAKMPTDFCLSHDNGIAMQKQIAMTLDTLIQYEKDTVKVLGFRDLKKQLDGALNTSTTKKIKAILCSIKSR